MSKKCPQKCLQIFQTNVENISKKMFKNISKNFKKNSKNFKKNFHKISKKYFEKM